MAIKRFPGFIDVHVHLRDPGATQKEDFATGTRAALAGGFTYVLDMPNNPTPTVSIARLTEKINLADEKAVCDLGFHYGTDGQNIASFAEAAGNSRVFGLKIYCNHTTGEMLIEDRPVLEKIFGAWEFNKPILVHAEGEQLAMAIELAGKFQRRLHVCHISQASEVVMVRQAKEQGLAITAGVCPHHLFLIDQDREKLGAFGIMKPPLGTAADRDGLWQGLADGTIDLVETDHAPHTREEKAGDPPPFGVPGLETAAGLLFKAVHDGKLAEDQVVTLLHDNPKAIFAIADQPDTFIELDPSKPYTIGQGGYVSKCGWSPFDGWEAYGQVESVVLRGKPVVGGGELLI